MRTSTRHRYLILYAVWLFGIIAYFTPAGTWSPVSRFNVTRAIVERRTLSIDAFVESTGDCALVDGHWYSDKAPLPSLLAVPVYALVHGVHTALGLRPEFRATATQSLPAVRLQVNDAYRRGYYLASLSTSGVAAVVVALLLFEWLRRRHAPVLAFAVSAAAVLATPLFPYATSAYGHVPAAAFLLAGVLSLSAVKRRSARRRRPDRRIQRKLWVAGGCLAAAVGCEYIVAFPVLALVLWATWRQHRRDRFAMLAHLAAGAALPVLVVSAYHTACFGRPWLTGYSFIQRPEFAAGHASGLLGLHLPKPGVVLELLVGTRRGLFYVSPLLVAGAIGLVLRGQRGRRWARASQLAAVILVLVNSGYYMWWGGAASAPRHLLPVVPLLALGLAPLIERRDLRVPLALLALVSFAIALGSAAVGVEGPEHGDIIRDYLWPRLVAGRIAGFSVATNVGIQLGLPPAASLSPLLVWVLLGARLLVIQGSSEPSLQD